MNVSTPLPGALDQLRELHRSLTRWEPFIKEALAHGHHAHTFDDIVHMILQNRVQFFAYPEAFCIMELVTYPQFKVYHCFLAGGKDEAVLAIEEPMTAIARSLECRYLSFAGRAGWQRILAKRGWTFACVTMYRDIGETPDERRRREGRREHAEGRD